MNLDMSKVHQHLTANANAMVCAEHELSQVLESLERQDPADPLAIEVGMALDALNAAARHICRVRQGLGLQGGN
ncbi:hypothetical protein V3390_00250 [Luteimonas sp. FXH3W]|uniref:Uncharacterized protein n=1 Tax=Aquilutibacter rugosus TaxID=3115820 RepID=A0ABU7UWS7_9GAMM